MIFATLDLGSLIGRGVSIMMSNRKKQTTDSYDIDGTTTIRRTHWMGALALLGVLLLCIGVSISSAAVLDDELLPNIIKQLRKQGKMIKSTSMITVGGEPQVMVVLANGEVRKYNSSGQMTESKDPYGKITLYEDGLQKEERNAKGGVISKTEYMRSETGKLKQSVKRSAAGTETKLYNNEGDVIQSTDAHGTRAYS